MGSGGSKPSAPAPAPAPRPAPIQQRVIEDPKPAGGDNTTGVSVSGAKECEVCDSYKPRKNCGSCKLIVNSNISTSVVTLTRSDSETSTGSQNKCGEGETSRPASKTKKGGASEFACEKNGIMTYHRDVDPAFIAAKTHCDDGYDEYERTGLDGGKVNIRCFGPCGGGRQVNPMQRWECEDIDTDWRGERAKHGHRPQYNLILTPKKTTTTAFSADKKLFIRPDKPFEVSFSGQKFMINQMAIYRPSPIRVENVQADAVLSLNDYSDPSAKVVILLPISAAVTYGSPGDFVGRVMQNVNAFTVNEVTGQYNPLNVPVGNDWSLTRVLEVADGKNNEVAGGFFKWESGQYERYVVSQSPSLLRYGWRQKPGGITTIMMKEPIGVSYVTSSYLAMLPYAPSAESAPAPAASYTYKAPICKSCKNAGKVDPAKFEAIKEANKSFFNPVDTVKWAIALFFGMAAFVAIYFALEFALKGNGQFLRGIATSVAQYLVMPRKRSATVAPEPTPAQ